MNKTDRIVKLTQQLIRINSENPPGNEESLAVFVCKFLEKFKYRPRIVEFAPRRSNVLCTLKSKKSIKRILLSPHLDTVPAGEGWRMPPFEGEILRNKIYGRGASDCKSNLAVALDVLARLKEAGPVLENLDVIFAATADEETGSSLGFKPLLKRILPLDYALVLDGRDFEIVYAQKGLLHLRINIFGRKAHGASPRKGRNAIKQAMRVYKDIEDWLRAVNKNDRKARFSVNIGKVAGGEKVNIVADRCSMDLDFRFAKEVKMKYLLAKIRKLISKAAREFSLEVLAFQNRVTVSRENILARALRASLRRRALSPKMEVCKGATVLSFLAEQNIPALIFGFASRDQAHVTDEYIEIPNLKKGSQVLRDFLIMLDKVIGAEAQSRTCCRRR